MTETTATPFVMIEDVAKYFIVSVSTVRTWVRNGTIPKSTYIKIGGTYRFDLPKVVDALISVPKQMELDLEDNQEAN